MQSDFDPNRGLGLWHWVTLEIVRGEGPDLTARQMAVLLTVYLEERPHTVRNLARQLDISKPAVTRALDRLCMIGLLRRETDEKDRRSVLIKQTDEGTAFLRDFGETIRRAAARLENGSPE